MSIYHALLGLSRGHGAVTRKGYGEVRRQRFSAESGQLSDLYGLMRCGHWPPLGNGRGNGNGSGESVVTLFDGNPHQYAVKDLEYWRRPQNHLRALWRYERPDSGQATQ